MEALFSRGLGTDLTPGLKSELRELGLDLERLLPAYEVSLVVRGVDVVVKHLPHREGPAAARRELGRRFMQGYRHTLIGGAMVAMMRLISPERTLARMERNFRTGTNYMQTRLELVAPGHARLWLNEVTGMAEVWEGILLEGAQLAGTREVTVTLERDPRGPGATYTLRWTAG